MDGLSQGGRPPSSRACWLGGSSAGEEAGNGSEKAGKDSTSESEKPRKSGSGEGTDEHDVSQVRETEHRL